VEIAIAKLKKYKSPGSDQIPAELIRFSAFVRYWRKKGGTMRQYISYS
jgi:hypothetical protein